MPIETPRNQQVEGELPQESDGVRDVLLAGYEGLSNPNEDWTVTYSDVEREYRKRMDEAILKGESVFVFASNLEVDMFLTPDADKLITYYVNGQVIGHIVSDCLPLESEESVRLFVGNPVSNELRYGGEVMKLKEAVELLQELDN